MWQKADFNPQVIERELKCAEGLGFNTVRVFLSNMVYNDDPDGFKGRFETLLRLADRHNIRVLPTFWTNGGKCENPRLGKQPESIKGIHNSQWVTTPGLNMSTIPQNGLSSSGW